jgi:hypothetical protein
MLKYNVDTGEIQWTLDGILLGPPVFVAPGQVADILALRVTGAISGRLGNMFVSQFIIKDRDETMTIFYEPGPFAGGPIIDNRISFIRFEIPPNLVQTGFTIIGQAVMEWPGMMPMQSNISFQLKIESGDCYTPPNNL